MSFSRVPCGWLDIYFLSTPCVHTQSCIPSHASTEITPVLQIEIKHWSTDSALCKHPSPHSYMLMSEVKAEAVPCLQVGFTL